MISREDFYRITNVEQHSQFQKILEKMVFDKEKRENFYRDCLDCDYHCGNQDMFRQYFEEYASERKSNQQDFTPESICKLVSELTKTTTRGGWTACDCAAGTGSLIIRKWLEERNKHLPWNYYPHNYLYLAEELSDVAIPYLIHNLAFRGMNAVVIHGNSIERKIKQIYFIQNAQDDPSYFSSVNVLPHSENVTKYFNVKKWLEKEIEHVEDELEDVIWKVSDSDEN